MAFEIWGSTFVLLHRTAYKTEFLGDVRRVDTIDGVRHLLADKRVTEALQSLTLQLESDVGMTVVVPRATDDRQTDVAEMRAHVERVWRGTL